MNLPKVNRGKFIQYSAALGSGVAISPLLSPSASAESKAQRDAYWYARWENKILQV